MKGTLQEDQYPLISHLAHIFVEREMFETNVTEKIKKHVLYSSAFSSENRAVCEIMWKNIVEGDRTQVTIWRMRIACWIPKAINQVV